VHIAVVIPALQEADRIQEAIESAQAPDAEVVVVDGGSRDGTRERARAAGARVVESAPGRARQLAAGARETEAEVLLFLHADTRLPEGWDAAVRGALADPGVAGGAFDFRFDDHGPEGSGFEAGELRLRWIEWGVRLRLALARLPYGDQALFLRRSVLEAMGGVPQVPIMEDLDLVRGIRAAGRLALLRLPVRISPRRYVESGVLRTWLRNAGALVAWRLGLDRERVAAWYRQ
jgi:rSAM/selenodomain-associated transferase 2